MVSLIVQLWCSILLECIAYVPNIKVYQIEMFGITETDSARKQCQSVTPSLTDVTLRMTLAAASTAGTDTATATAQPQAQAVWAVALTLILTLALTLTLSL